MCNVIRDGAGREDEALRDLLIGEPVRDQRGNLPLAARERLDISVRLHLDFSGCVGIFHAQPSVRAACGVSHDAEWGEYSRSAQRQRSEPICRKSCQA